MDVKKKIKMENKIKLKEIKIRPLSLADLRLVKEFLDYHNSLVKEEVMMLTKKNKTLKEEKEWLKEKIKKVKDKKLVFLVAEDNGKIVGIVSISSEKGRQDHIGGLGISVRKEYRGIGLGKKLMKEILKLAKKELKPRPKIIRLSVFSTNKIAQNLYKKMGFKIVAKVPKQFQYKGKLVDEIIMIKKL
jgi:ribosomal protein S18 acetylase RimI-like enzyme